MATYAILAICVAAAVLLAVGGLKLVRHIVPLEILQPHHNVSGWFLSIAGTLYAVVLGFIVVDALNNFQAARVTVEKEASGLHDVYHLARGLPEPLNGGMRTLCMNYTKMVADDEWSTMESGKPSAKAHRLLADMWGLATTFEPKNAAQSNIHAAILSEMQRIGDARHTRLLGAKPGYDAVLWFVLIVGGIVTVVFTYFFGLDDERIQILMTALITIVLSLNMVLVALFGSPFSGDVKVSAEPFRTDIENFQEEAAEP